MNNRTRVGDRVRLCWDGYPGSHDERLKHALLDSQIYRVQSVSTDGERVKVANNWFDSWVRVPAKKGRK